MSNLWLNFKRGVYPIVNRLRNNVLVNNAAILLDCEDWVKNTTRYWSRCAYNPNKTLQENIQISHRPEIDACIKSLHESLQKAAHSLYPEGGSVLDIGCGLGLYLQDFDERYQLTGIDISSDWVQEASKRLPHARVLCGDINNLGFSDDFDFAYTISVLQYVSRRKLDRFLRRVNRALKPGGTFFLHYHHALSWMDLLTPDIDYIQYSPRQIEKAAGKYFSTLEHHHAFRENGKITWIDPNPYSGAGFIGNRTFQNSYIYIGRKYEG